MECAECEWDLRAGHAPSCSRRCKATDGTEQCERATDHPGVHAIYDEWGEDIKRCWPNRAGDTDG